MTIGIAAVCKLPENLGRAVIACSDRMLTFGLTEYQPEQQKAYMFLPEPRNIMALAAGNIGQALTILDGAHRRIIQNPTKDTDVVADVVCEQFAIYQRQLVQRQVLDPFGLTHSAFLDRHRTLDPDFIRRLTGMM